MKIWMTIPDKTKNPSLSLSFLWWYPERGWHLKKGKNKVTNPKVSLDSLGQRWEFNNGNLTPQGFLTHELWLLLTWVLALQHPVVRYFTGSQLCEEILFGFDFSTDLKPFCSCFGSKEGNSLLLLHTSHVSWDWRDSLNHSLKTDIHLSNHSHPSVAIFQFYYTLSQDERREKLRVTHTTWEKKKPWILTAVYSSLPNTSVLCLLTLTWPLTQNIHP